MYKDDPIQAVRSRGRRGRRGLGLLPDSGMILRTFVARSAVPPPGAHVLAHLNKSSEQRATVEIHGA